MTTYSKILRKYYDNSNVIYISNMIQAYKYLNSSEEVVNDLVDIIYSGNRKDCLVFVFNRTPLIKELYTKWQSHELE